MIKLMKGHVIVGQELADLISTGIEGISGGWVRKIELERCTVPITETPWYADPAIWDSEETTIKVEFEDGETDGTVTKIFDHASLVAALQLWARGDESSFGDFAEDSGDAETSDIFFQFWFIGAVIFG